MGQPTKLTPDTQKEMVRRLQVGMPIKEACEHLLISDRTHYNWMARGELEWERLNTNTRARPRKSEDRYLRYFQAVKSAGRDAHLRNLSVVAAAARGGQEHDTQTIETYYKDGTLKERKTITRRQAPQWQAAAWYLERRRPDLYSRTVKQEVTGAGGGPVESVGMSKEEYMEVVRDNLSKANHLVDLFEGEDDAV